MHHSCNADCLCSTCSSFSSVLLLLPPVLQRKSPQTQMRCCYIAGSYHCGKAVSQNTGLQHNFNVAKPSKCKCAALFLFFQTACRHKLMPRKRMSVPLCCPSWTRWRERRTHACALAMDAPIIRCTLYPRRDAAYMLCIPAFALLP